MTNSFRLRKAIFPVGGLGTRFLPATKAIPKEMLPVLDRPLIHHAFEEARAAGCDQFIFVTGRGKSAIEDHFDHSYELAETLRRRDRSDLVSAMAGWLPSAGEVVYIRQGEPLGLGHAIWSARKLIGDEPVAVLLADDLIISPKCCLAQMADSYRPEHGSLVALQQVAPDRLSSYGIADPCPGSMADLGVTVPLRGLVEKPTRAAAPSNLAVIGRYILHPSVFDALDGIVSAARGDGHDSEIQLTAGLADTIDPIGVHGFMFEGKRFDCGHPLGLLQANLHLALQRDDFRYGLRDTLDELRASRPTQPSAGKSN